jgi:uncharacterized repeat protein (TIGR03803 family)
MNYVRATFRHMIGQLLFVMLIITLTLAAIPASAATFHVLYDGLRGTGTNTQNFKFTQARDGQLYVTANNGGIVNGNCLFGCGQILAMTPAGIVTQIHAFDYVSEGAFPRGGLTLGTDGNLYGVLSASANGKFGSVFKITTAGAVTLLHTFSDTGDGASPSLPPIQATDGNFYGTVGSSGSSGNGVLYRLTPTGTFTVLHTFDRNVDGDGGSAVVQGADGKLYTVAAEGPGGWGTVLQFTVTGTVKVLHNFATDQSEGTSPMGPLVQAGDGNFYGACNEGGAHSSGTIWRISPSGSFQLLYSVNGTTDGQFPGNALSLGTDGKLYGSTQYQGVNGGPGTGGTIFQFTTAGNYSVLFSFTGGSGASGSFPNTILTQDTNGLFYGVTAVGGGADGDGTFYDLDNGLAPFVSLQPVTGHVGAPVTVLGTNLLGSTSVTFNGTAATFTVVSASEITTNVPAGATTGAVQVTTPGGTLTSNANFQVVPLLQLVPVTPCRLVDTRPQYGGSGPIQGGTFQSFNLPQLAQGKGCADLSSAAAYSLNVAVVPQGSLSYLTLWPKGQDQPVVATLNSLDGRIKANAAVVQAGVQSSVNVYVTNTANVVIDIDGYFAPSSSSTLAFFPLTPCRVADTRKSNFPPGLGTPHLFAGTERDFPVLSSNCSIPSTAKAYSLNLAVVPYPSLGNPLGYLEVWPKDQKPQNPVSTLNNLTGTIVANAAIVPAGTGGDIAVYPSNDTDLIIDVNGYFALAGPGGLSLYPAVPCRVIDTRKLGPPFGGTLSPPVDVLDSVCGPSSTAQAYVFNATAVPAGALGYLTLWPDGTTQPVVSTLNAIDGAITNNMAIVPTTNGKVNAYASGLTQLILDISSYFAP